MPDRTHEKHTETTINKEEFRQYEKEGASDAQAGKSAWECPYFATDSQELKKVRAWIKGYEDYIKIHGRPKK
jgi:hypothetical protein